MRRLLATLAVTAAVAAALPAAAPASSVLGGRPASQPYPFMAALRDGGDQFCGASLIAPQIALTAAHCVTDAQPGGLDVLLGQTRLSGSGGEAIPIASIQVHESYEGDPAQGYDIALLTLQEASTMAPIRIAGGGDRALWEPGDVVRVIGWGSSVYLVGPGHDDLQEVDLPVVSDADCSDTYSEFDSTTMVCAGEESGFKDSCQGDSGGPMFAFDAAGVPVQVAVVSWGLGCGFPGHYGVYGRVADPILRDWIAARVPGLNAPAPAPAPAPGPTPTSASTPAPAPAGASPPASSPSGPATRLRYVQNLGSARVARRRHRIRLRILATGPVRRLRATLTTRRGRVLARGRISRVNGRAMLTLRLTRRARPAAGTLRLALRGTDARGRRVSASGVAFLRR